MRREGGIHRLDDICKRFRQAGNGGTRFARPMREYITGFRYSLNRHRGFERVIFVRNSRIYRTLSIICRTYRHREIGRYKHRTQDGVGRYRVHIRIVGMAVLPMVEPVTRFGYSRNLSHLVMPVLTGTGNIAQRRTVGSSTHAENPIGKICIEPHSAHRGMRVGKYGIG